MLYCRSEQGSNSNLSKASSRPSLVLSVINRVLKSSRSQFNTDTRCGSHSSLMSKASRQRRKRRRNTRSISRINSQTQSPTHRVHPVQSSSPTGAQNEEIFKMSSMSSLTSHFNVPSESEFSSMHNSKNDMRDLLKHDFNSFTRQQNGQPGLRNIKSDHNFMARTTGEIKRGMTIDSAGAGGSLEHISHLENKILRQKLEAVQSLQTEILAFLDHEIETHERFHDRGDGVEDAAYLVNSLEDRTELLKRHILRRMHQKRKVSEASNSPRESKVEPEVAPFATEPGTDSPTAFLLSRKSSLCHENMVALQDDVQPDHCNETIEDNTIPEVFMNATANLAPTSSLPDTVDSYPDPGELDPESIDSSATMASAESASPADAAYELELSTIEEQPELGYQSDSSDTEMLLPKNETGKGKYKKNVNLETVDEEEQLVAIANTGSGGGSSADC